MDKMADLIGTKIGKLTPIEVYRKQKPKGRIRIYYLCKCDCGNFSLVTRENLGQCTTSCGCYKKKYVGDKYRKHGMTKTRFYGIWANMKTRVLNPKSYDYKYYGQRGISLDDRWLEFNNFKTDMYDSYLVHVKDHGEKNTTLDRIDGNQNYEKTNCRWATMQIQNDNKELGRKPFIATNILTGETHEGLSRAEIGRRLGINDSQIGNVLKGKREQTCGYTFKYIDKIPAKPL